MEILLNCMGRKEAAYRETKRQDEAPRSSLAVVHWPGWGSDAGASGWGFERFSWGQP